MVDAHGQAIMAFGHSIVGHGGDGDVMDNFIACLADEIEGLVHFNNIRGVGDDQLDVISVKFIGYKLQLFFISRNEPDIHRSIAVVEQPGQFPLR